MWNIKGIGEKVAKQQMINRVIAAVNMAGQYYKSVTSSHKLI